jgi:hypothetical protein
MYKYDQHSDLYVDQYGHPKQIMIAESCIDSAEEFILAINAAHGHRVRRCGICDNLGTCH